MSNDSPNSPLTNLWRVTAVLCGSAVLMWITVRIIAGIWQWLLGIAVALIAFSVIVVVLRRWRDQHRF